MSRDGIIRKTKDGYESVFERHLPHPPERVWAMITDPKQIQKWYVRVEIEPRAGGRIVEHHDHVGLSMTGRVTRYDPPRVFEHTWWENEEEERIAGTVTWEVIPEGTGTRLVLTNRFSRLEGAQGSMAGWHICLDVMSAVLDGADPSAHAPPRGTFQNGRFIQTHPGRGRWADRERLENEYKKHLGRAKP